MRDRGTAVPPAKILVAKVEISKGAAESDDAQVQAPRQRQRRLTGICRMPRIGQRRPEDDTQTFPIALVQIAASFDEEIRCIPAKCVRQRHVIRRGQGALQCLPASGFTGGGWRLRLRAKADLPLPCLVL